MITPRVAVIVPCFNCGWSIERTMRSILAQTLADFELVVVDDGSHDDSIAVLERFSGDPRLRSVRQPNAGVAAARNRAIRGTVAPLIAPIDADDLWHPDYLATLVAALDARPDAPFAYADSWRIDERDRIIRWPDVPRAIRHDFVGLLSINSVNCGSAAVFRRSSLPVGQPYDERLRGPEDWKLILQLASRGTPIFCRRKLVAYRISSTSLSRGNPERQLVSLLTVIAEMRSSHRDIADRWFRDARTMMRAYIVPALLRHRRYARALRELLLAYGCNPLVWRNRNIRAVHAARARVAVAGLLRQGASDGGPLAELVVEGRKPFAFLAGAIE